MNRPLAATLRGGPVCRGPARRGPVRRRHQPGRLARLLQQRATASRAESGFALLFVLGAIALTSVVIVALLGLAMTSSRVTISQRQNATEVRAASGAIESAVGQVALSEADEPCSGMPAGGVASIDFEPGPSGDPTTVQVECWNQDLSPTLPTEATQPQLESMTPAPNLPGGRHRFGTVDGMSFDCQLSLPPCAPTFTTTWSSAGTQPLRSARLLFQSFEGENVHNLNRNLTVTVTPTSGGGCSVAMPGGRTNFDAGVYTSVDLFDSDSCRARFADATQEVFDGATIRVVHRYRAAEGCPIGCTAALTVGEVKLVTNIDALEASSASGGSWGNVASARTLDGQAAAVSQSACSPSEERCRIETAGSSFAMTLSGFDTSSIDGVDPGDYVDQLGVFIDSPENAPVRSWISDPIDETGFSVTLSVGAVECQAVHDGFSRSNQQMYVDLLGSGDCRDAVQILEDLQGATLTYSVTANCLHIGNTRAPEDSNGRCMSVRLPNLDRVALAVATVPLPRESIVTLSASVDGDTVAQADVYFDGEAAAPRPTPVVAWRHEDFVEPPPPSTP